MPSPRAPAGEGAKENASLHPRKGDDAERLGFAPGGAALAALGQSPSDGAEARGTPLARRAGAVASAEGKALGRRVRPSPTEQGGAAPPP